MNKIQSKIKKYPLGGTLNTIKENALSLLDHNKLKQAIANAETIGEEDPYTAVNPNTKAYGKYQIHPKYHPDFDVKKATPEYQELYMDKLINGYNKAGLELQKKYPDKSLNDLALLVHFQGLKGAKKLLADPSTMDNNTSINPSPNQYLDRSKGIYKDGGKLPKYEDGSVLPNIPTENTLHSLEGGLGDATDFLGKDSKFGKITKFIGEKALPFTGVAGAVGALGVGAMIGLDQRSQRLADERLEQSKNLTNQKKTIINSYIQPNVGEGLPGFAEGGQLPNFPMDKMLIAMESGGNINPQYIMKDGGGFHINPAHKGFCTPMSKATCTGKRRTFALNAKHHFKKWKHEDGGDINNVKNNDLITYNGASHEEGGININQAGIPNNTNPKAEVEGGESGVGSYIFSDTIGIDKKGNPTLRQPVKTFSDMAKKIDKRYKGKEDRLAQATKEFEYSNLKAKNDEALEMKVQQGFERFKKKYGGMVKMRYGGADESPTPYFNPNVADVLNLPPQRTPSWWNIPANMEGSISNPVDLPNVTVNGTPNIPGNNIPYLDNPRVGKNWNLNPVPNYVDNDGRGVDWNSDGTIKEPYIAPIKANPLVYSDGTTEYPMKPATKMESPLVLPKPEKVNNIDYAGLGLSTIAPAINFAYGMKKDDNKYYANEKYGQAKNYLNQLPTDINIDANLAANTRDFKAASADVNRRTPSVGNSVTSQLLSNKLNANNTLYQSKYNAENQLKSGKLSALSNLDYTAGETDRNQRIALEDKNLANKARREDLQLNAIKDATTNLNVLRNESTLKANMKDLFKYGTFEQNDKGQLVWKSKPGTPLQISRMYEGKTYDDINGK